MILFGLHTVRAGALVALVGTSLSAQERTLFTWSGAVDREIVLVMSGRNVESRGAGLDASFRPRLDLREGLPRQDGYVAVQLAGGRGHAEVLSHPSARNDYTTTIRITDARAGADNYRVVASWRPADNDWRDAGRNGRDRDDDWDRRRRDNDCYRPFPGNSRGRGDERWEERNRRNCDDDWSRGRRDAGMLRWSGFVDDVTEIRITGRRVEYRTRSGAPVRNVDMDVLGNPLPRRNVYVELHNVRGRGSLAIVQQPSRHNNYTAVIRVVDRRAGYGAYDFDIRW